MVQVNRITGGSDEFINLIRGIQARVSTLETRSTGSMYISGQIITQDPNTGVETIFGALPDGSHGFREWINDTTPPNAPSTPVAAGDRAVFEITWDGKDKDGFSQPVDYDRTVVQMATTNVNPIWVEVNYFGAAGRVVIGGQPYSEARYFRLISYDKNGNASAPSLTASATLVSPMNSPEMTTYINQVELDIKNAEKAGVDAASGKNTNYYGTVAPTAPAGGFTVGDLWFDEANNNEPKRWNGTVWATVRDAEIAVVDNRVDTVVTTVNGKNTNTTSTSVAPTTYTGATGDIWWQKDTAAPYAIIKQSTWDATAKAWTEQQVGSTVLANVDAGKISSGTIDAGRIGADSITADKIVIGTTANLVPDPQFRFPAEWSGGYVDAQGTGMNGGGSFLIGDGTVQRGGYLGLSNIAFRIPVIPGLKYRVGTWFNTSLSAPVDSLALYVRVYSSTDTTKTFTFASPNRVRNLSATVVNTWTEMSDMMTIPDGYDRMVIGLYAQSTYTGSVRFSDPYIQQATSNVLIANGSVSAAKMVTGTITADSGIIGSLDAGSITVGEMNGARVKAGSIQADRLVVGQGENFIVDSNFPAPVASPPNSTQSRFDRASAGISWVSPNRVGWNATVADTTTRVIRLGNQIENADLATIPVIPGRNYVVSWQVYSDAVSTTVGTRAAIAWVKEDGTSTYVAGSPATFTPISAVGVNSEITNEFTAPADAVKMRVDLQTNGHHGGGRLDFMRPVVRLMTDGTIITKDAVLTKHIKAGQITGDVLDVSYIKGQVVVSNMFEGSTFTGGVFQQATFETSPLANTGIKMSPTLGLIGYNGSQQPVFQVDPSGNATFTGKVNVIAGSTIPQSTVTDLTTTLNDHGKAVDTVWSWADPVNTTLIDGGNISTDSITANQIALGSGQNFITGGDGGDRTGWNDFEYQDTNSAWPSNVKSLYVLRNNKLAYSPAFSVSGLNKYSFSYSFASSDTNIYHVVAVAFYDINGSYISMVSLGRKASSAPWGISSGSVSDQKAPVNAVTAKVYIEHNWQTGDALGTTQFANFQLMTGAQTRITSSGLTSYNAGVQTLRLNGEDNLMIGEVLTGRPGVEPYIKLSSRSNVAAIDFHSVEDPAITTDQTNHGAVWWQVPTDVGQEYGQLRLYAIDDEPLITNNRRFAAGIDIRSTGYLEFHGKLSKKSETFQGGSIHFTGELAANSAIGPFTQTFPTPFPSSDTFDNISVQLTCVTSGGAALLAVVTARGTTSFNYKIFNLSSFGSGTTRLAWTATRVQR